MLIEAARTGLRDPPPQLSPSARQRALGAVILALVLQAALLGGLIACARAWPARLPWALGLLVAAALPLPLAAVGLARLPVRQVLTVVLLGAVLLRALLVPLPPLLSTDVHRFLWDGRVLAHGLNPYGVAPSDPRLDALGDEHRARVNHAELPTIYPPVAQLVFAAVVKAGGGLTALKAVLAAADLLTALALFALLGPGRRHHCVLHAWHPLVVSETALAGHADGLGMALMVLGVLAAVRGRHVLSALLVAGAAGVKVLLAVVGPLLRPAVSRLVLVLALAVMVLPFLAAGPRAFDSFETVARRWRMNPGAYSVVHALVYRAVVRPGGSRVPIAVGPTTERLVGGRGWDHVLADDIASFSARAVAAVAVLVTLAVVLWRGFPLDRAALWVLGVVLVASPTVHPWYLLWILPFAVLRGAWAWSVFAALMPLTYLPLAKYMTSGEWHEPLAIRIGLYLVLFGGLLVDPLRRCYVRRSLERA
jgi:hypothetical protein